MTDIVDRARQEARGLRFVAGRNRRKGEVLYAVRQLDHLANALDEAAAEIEYLRAERDAHQLTKIQLVEARTEIARLEAVNRG